MEYQVPQFIEIEDKIIGPLTIKQFIYLAGTIGLCVTFFMSFSTIIAVLLSAPVAALGGALAFYKINGKPFIEVLEAGFNYYTGSKFFLWKHSDSAATSQATAASLAAAEAEAASKVPVPKLTRGRLSALALSLDMPQNTDIDEPEVLHGSTKLSPQ